MQTFRTQILLFVCCIIRLVMCSCKEGWKSFDSSCYKFGANTANWQDARNACLKMAADLVVVRNKEENNFLNYSSLNYNSNFWLGLTDIKEEDNFMWIDNGECSNFSHFSRNEPNNYNGDEGCVEYLRGTGKWNDQNCSNTIMYVCEKYQDNTPPSYGSSCPDDIHLLFSSTTRSASVYWLPPTWNDNSFCDPTVNCSHFPGHVIAIPDGDSTAFINVTCTANDKAGNSETCYFRVTASYPSATPDSSGHPVLQTPGSSRYPGLTIGMFFVGIIVGVFGVLAGSLGYNRIKRIPTQTSQTYMGYVADGHDESNKHTYEDLQHTTEEVATYVNSNIKPHNRTANSTNAQLDKKTTVAYANYQDKK